MKAFYIFIKSGNGLDKVSETIRHALNVANRNTSPGGQSQKGHGINRGGDYYLFECFGLEFMLIQNAGEVLIPEYEDWQFYVVLHSEKLHIDKKSLAVFAEHFKGLLQDEGLIAEIEAEKS